MVSEDVEYGGVGKGHVAREVWSNEFKKWIFFDPQYGAYMERERDVPLSYYEIFKEHQKNGWRNLKTHFLVSIEKDGALNEYQKFIEQYFGAINTSLGNRDFTLGLNKKNPYLVFQGMSDIFRFFTSDPKDVYPILNKTEVNISYDYQLPDYDKFFSQIDSSLTIEEVNKVYLKKLPEFAAKPIFKLTFINISPYFSHYEVMVNGEDWEKVERHYYRWEINKEGLHSFHVRLVDKFGRIGIESFVKIDYR